MKKRFLSISINLIAVFFATFIITSCNQRSTNEENDKASKEKDSLKKENELYNKEQDTNQKSEMPATDTPITNTYRVIVAFISKGEGPDTKTLDSFTAYITSFEKKIGKAITFEKYPWGKEGEADYCFYCKEMNTGEQKDFVTGLTNLTKEAPLVIVKENAVCSHKK